MLSYTILYYTILYYDILYYDILYYTILYYTILCYTILYYTILYYAILSHTILYYAILNLTVKCKYAFGDFFRIYLLQCFYWLNINSFILALSVTLLCINTFFFKDFQYSLTNTFTCNLYICKNS